MAITLLLGALLAACGTGTADQPSGDGTALPGPGDLQATPMTGDTGMNGDAITLSDIANNPEQYIGQMVTIRAPLGEVLGPRAFTLSDPALVSFDSLLVVGVDNTTIPTEGAVEDAEVEVTGTVREFHVMALEQELAYEFPDPVLGAYSDETAIVAESVRILPETE